MKRTQLTTVLVALSVAAVGYGLYSESSGAQHRRPDNAPPQTAQPRSTPPPQAGQPRTSPPPPAQPPDGQNTGRSRPPDAPVVGRAEPRQAPPPRPGHPGHGGAVYYPGPWYGWYGYPGYSPSPWSKLPPVSIAADWAMSKVRLEVTPKSASVYVDRYYAGTVDDFDGFFSPLSLPAGVHLLEIRKEGYRTLVTEVNLEAGQTIRYKRTMEPIDAAATPAEHREPFDQTDDPERFVQISGHLRFDVRPKDAEVYADGYYAGIADDFTGSSQLLALAPGRHHIELRATGCESVEFDVNVEPGQTVDYRTELVAR